MARAAAKTGLGPTVTVAVEQHFPEGQRIIEDELAIPILPRPMRAFVWLTHVSFVRDRMVQAMEKSAPGIWGGVMYRKRYIDDRLTEDVASVEAVVNLGAGFDTRAYRLPALKNMPIWEVDQRHNIELKRARLREVLGEVPAHVTLVPIDFDREELGTVLPAHGYSAEMRSFFIMEAVTQYLTSDGIESTFGFLAQAASGSRLAFTYVLKDFITGKEMHHQKALYDKWVVQEKAWLYGLDPQDVPDFLGGYGWRVVEDVDYPYLAAKYPKPVGRDLKSTPIERIVYAEKP